MLAKKSFSWQQQQLQQQQLESEAKLSQKIVTRYHSAVLVDAICQACILCVFLRQLIHWPVYAESIFTAVRLDGGGLWLAATSSLTGGVSCNRSDGSNKQRVGGTVAVVLSSVISTSPCPDGAVQYFLNELR